ncbi:hypothetical protein ASC54_05330 [Yonghaparkia sp. Root332]|nr:hypothetical protein ASC54_05330 [Yonghaparkia sp. Root332]
MAAQARRIDATPKITAMTALAALAAAPLARPTEGGGVFDLIGGLPVHPLVVHLAVIALPVAALGLIVAMAFPRVHAAVRWSVVGALAVGAVSAWVASESGEALSERVGEPEVHAELGEKLPVIAGIALLLGIVWAVISHLMARAARRGATPVRALAIARIVVSVIAAGWMIYTVWYTILVGHSGAESVWMSRLGG